MLEVEEKGGFELGYVEIAEHLGDMGVSERGDDLGIDQNALIDEEVRNESADFLSFIVDGVLLLLLAGKAQLGKFDNERAFVDFFIETGLQGVENLHGRTNDTFGKFLVVGEHGFVIGGLCISSSHPCLSVLSVVVSVYPCHPWFFMSFSEYQCSSVSIIGCFSSSVFIRAIRGCLCPFISGAARKRGCWR